MRGILPLRPPRTPLPLRLVRASTVAAHTAQEIRLRVHGLQQLLADRERHARVGAHAVDHLWFWVGGEFGHFRATDG